MTLHEAMELVFRDNGGGRTDLCKGTSLSAEVRRLKEFISRIELEPSGHLAAVERERDRYRADASSLRAAALRLNVAAGDVSAAVSRNCSTSSTSRGRL